MIQRAGSTGVRSHNSFGDFVAEMLPLFVEEHTGIEILPHETTKDGRSFRCEPCVGVFLKVTQGRGGGVRIHIHLDSKGDDPTDTQIAQEVMNRLKVGLAPAFPSLAQYEMCELESDLGVGPGVITDRQLDMVNRVVMARKKRGAIRWAGGDIEVRYEKIKYKINPIGNHEI